MIIYSKHSDFVNTRTKIGGFYLSVWVG